MRFGRGSKPVEEADLLSKGERLLAETPASASSPDSINRWRWDVWLWLADLEESLPQNQAFIFMNNRDASFEGPSDRHPEVASDSMNLARAIRNLRSIRTPDRPTGSYKIWRNRNSYGRPAW